MRKLRFLPTNCVNRIFSNSSPRARRDHLPDCKFADANFLLAAVLGRFLSARFICDAMLTMEAKQKKFAQR
jgi:hypothetical protein